MRAAAKLSRAALLGNGVAPELRQVQACSFQVSQLHLVFLPLFTPITEYATQIMPPPGCIVVF